MRGRRPSYARPASLRASLDVAVRVTSGRDSVIREVDQCQLAAGKPKRLALAVGMRKRLAIQNMTAGTLRGMRTGARESRDAAVRAPSTIPGIVDPSLPIPGLALIVAIAVDMFLVAPVSVSRACLPGIARLIAPGATVRANGRAWLARADAIVLLQRTSPSSAKEFGGHRADTENTVR